ncbi:hypothetical protein [Cobetia sp. QF-1]|nr:hypothetical protein [Cobetia sp. QF-1]
MRRNEKYSHQNSMLMVAQVVLAEEIPEKTTPLILNFHLAMSSSDA